MPKFGTLEWAEQYMEELNKNEAYAEAASWWEGNFLFQINASGNLDHSISIYIGLSHGKCTGVKILAEGEEYKILKKEEKPTGEGIEVEYVYQASYDNWVKILKSELDPIRALLSRQAQINKDADLNKIMKAPKAAQELVRTCTLIETEFY